MVYIPVTEQMAPNAWVKVTLTRPRRSLPYLKSDPKRRSPQDPGQGDKEVYSDFDEGRNFDLGRPVELYGWKQIKVALTPAELSIDVKPDAPEKRPGEALC